MGKKHLMTVIAIIALGCALTACANGQGEKLQETGTLTISAEGQVLAEVPLDEIKQYPSVRRNMVINSSQGSSSHDFRGTLVANILNDIDPTLMERFDSIKTVGVDDYLSAISMEEVKQENNIYIMYSDSEQPLLTKEGEPYGMRIVALDDQFGQRFTNYLVEIVLE